MAVLTVGFSLRKEIIGYGYYVRMREGGSSNITPHLPGVIFTILPPPPPKKSLHPKTTLLPRIKKKKKKTKFQRVSLGIFLRFSPPFGHLWLKSGLLQSLSAYSLEYG
jgi:hypothetical protein